MEHKGDKKMLKFNASNCKFKKIDVPQQDICSVDSGLYLCIYLENLNEKLSPKIEIQVIFFL